MNKKAKVSKHIIILYLLLVILVFGLIYTTTTKQVCEEGIYKELYYFDSIYDGTYESEELANGYYDLASEAYDLLDYSGVILNCQLSRDYSSLHVQEVREVIAEMDSEEELFLIYKNMLQEEVKIYNNLYEACEYFESSARCYNNNDYDCGGTNIDGHNEKIRAHDDAVNKYNEYFAEYNVLLRKLTE